MKFKSDENHCDDKHLDCVNQHKIIQVYSSESKQYIQDIKEELEEVVCSQPQFACTKHYEFEARYNCIGLAIGIIRWIEPEDINQYIKEGVETTNAINKFILKERENFPLSHPANLFKIIDKLEYSSNNPSLNNNTVAFYFKDGECQHAARYVTDFNSWISKLGEWVPITHNLPNLMGENYGNEIYYAELTGGIRHHELNDEL
jgi:hypothetical protein